MAPKKQIPVPESSSNSFFWMILDFKKEHAIQFWIFIITLITLLVAIYFSRTQEIVASKTLEIQNIQSDNQTIKDVLPEIPKIDVELGKTPTDNIREFQYSTNDSELSSTWVSNMVNAEFVATDASWKNLPISYPEKIWTWGIGKIDESNAVWEITIEARCNINHSIKLSENRVVPCTPKGKISDSVELPSLKWVTIVWLDATFAENNKYPLSSDKIDLNNSKKIFKWYWAYHYILQVVNALTIDSWNIYKDKRKVGFIFFNSKTTESNSENTLLVKRELEEIYRWHLDWFELYSFNEIAEDLNIRNSWWIIRYIFWIIGDCNTKEKWYCQKNLEMWKRLLFTKDMMSNNKIDYLYIIPTTKKRN